MKGLALSKKYYLECAKDQLEDRFGSLIDRIAIGMVGPGSECLGFDDEFSRDHDWGPAFCLWLTKEDYANYGKKINEFYASLPSEFAGFATRAVSAGESFRVGAMSIESFYRRYTGLPQPPETLSEWDIPATNLSLCVNGELFADTLGEFTAWRERLLQFYPEDIRRKKIADCCIKAGQAGQYNWQRGIMRKDSYVMNSAKMQFITEIMNIVFLLNKVYAPYFKWLFKSFKQLPILAEEIAPLLEMLMVTIDELQDVKGGWHGQQERIEKICAIVLEEIIRQGLSSRNESAFFMDHVSNILAGIEDKEFASQLWGVR